MSSVVFRPPLSRMMQQIRNGLESPIMRKRILVSASKALLFIVSARPKEGVWNRAPGTRGDNRWYQRGFGSRWKNKNRSLGGVNNSQNLQGSWNVEIKGDSSASVYTGVTYAPMIHDPQKRVNWASLHGWKSTDEIGEIFTPIFEEVALKEIDKAISELKRG